MKLTRTEADALDKAIKTSLSHARRRDPESVSDAMRVLENYLDDRSKKDGEVLLKALATGR